MKRLFVTYKSLTLSLLFIFLFSATVSFAAPLYNTGNTTLDPQCLPTNPDCRVSTATIADDFSVGNGFFVTTAPGYSGTGTATAGAPRLFIGTNTSSGDDSAILIGRGLVGTSLFSHAIRDESTFNSVLDSAYASFDSNPQMLGAEYYNHFRSFQARPNYNGTNHVSLLNGFNWQPVVSSGVVDQSIGFMVTDKIGAGTVLNNIGILIESLTSGTQTNYAIYSQGTSPSYLGGSLQLGAGLRATQVTATELGGVYGAVASLSGDGDLIDNPFLTIVNGVLTMSHGFGSKVLSSNADLQLESTSNSILIRPGGTTSATFGANGRLGLGTSTLTYTLNVGNSSVSGIVSSFQNSSGTCTINPTTTSLSCSSDRNLKKDITALDTNTLNKVLSLQPVTYHWNTESDIDSTHAGFIAQEVEAIFPDLVSTDPNTGLKSLAYTGLIPYTVKAIQDINIKVSAIPTYTDTTLYATISTFLDGIANRGEAVVNKVKTKELEADTICVKKSDGTSLCLTGDQLQGIVSGATIVVPSSTPTIQPEETPAELVPEPIVADDTIAEPAPTAIEEQPVAESVEGAQ